jgi:hypothetical protein
MSLVPPNRRQPSGGCSHKVGEGQEIPAVTSVLTDEAIGFAVRVIDSSGLPVMIEDLVATSTGRPRQLPVRALLVALLLLAIDDRPIHLKAATMLLFSLPDCWRHELAVTGKADNHKGFLARYRQVRYLFHRVLSVMDPSVEAKNRVEDRALAQSRRRQLTKEEITARTELLASVVGGLLGASIELLSDFELSGFDGSVGLDATPVPLYSRGPSGSSNKTASDPDGGWYIREGDHRTETGPNGKRLRKIHWALEATIAVMGRPPGSVPAYPNLVVGISLARPGVDPGAMATRLLASVRDSGLPAGYLGADRGYTQCRPENFHLPARALGYSPVMDYRTADLGVQANSQGAVMVEGTFYCPAMPKALVNASAEHRAGVIDDETYLKRIEARRMWRLIRKQGPDTDGYERFSCPATGDNPKLCCPLREPAKALGKIPVVSPPATPPKICCQSAVTIAPDIGVRFRQDLAFGSEQWQTTYAAYRNTIEGLNGYIKDGAHEALADPSRRRVRGVAAQSLFVALLAMAANIRKIAAHRALVADNMCAKVAGRARRRRMSLSDYRPPPKAY